MAFLGGLVIFLGYFLLIIFALLLVILVIPFRYKFYLSKKTSLKLFFKLAWLFNSAALVIVKNEDLTYSTYFEIFKARIVIKKQAKTNENEITKEIEPENTRLNLQKKQSAKSEKRKKKKKRRQLEVSQFLNRNFLQKVVKMVCDLLRWLQPDKFKVFLKIGFADPCNTGILAAVCYSIGLTEVRGFGIRPIFEEEVFEGIVSVRGRINIGALLYIVGKFILSKPVLNILINRKGTKVDGRIQYQG